MKTQTLKVSGMLLIRIEGAIVTNFSNAIEKEEFSTVKFNDGTYDNTDEETEEKEIKELMSLFSDFLKENPDINFRSIDYIERVYKESFETEM